MNEYTAANRDAWDAIADLRQEIWPSADFFARGGSLLPEHELTAAGDVRGLRLCHLQCGSGEETLSWANAGAEVTGVDISPRQIDMANRKAEAAGIAAEFLAADVSSRPEALDPESFDIVYTGGGALVWIPDLDNWAESVCQLLRPSGRLILNEEHPQLANLEVNDGSIEVSATTSTVSRNAQLAGAISPAPRTPPIPNGSSPGRSATSSPAWPAPASASRASRNSQARQSGDSATTSPPSAASSAHSSSSPASPAPNATTDAYGRPNSA